MSIEEEIELLELLQDLPLSRTKVHCVVRKPSGFFSMDGKALNKTESELRLGTEHLVIIEDVTTKTRR